MSDNLFKYQDDLLKHYVRTEAWLPLCKDRLAAVRQGKRPQIHKRLRYFTFCAVGAVDVLMLDVAKVLRQKNDRFDSVVFFDDTPEHVIEPQKRIPGAIGFPGKFADIVLLDDPDEESVVDGLDSPAETLDTQITRAAQKKLCMRRDFIRTFPFDVLNLDLYDFLFRPTDPLPGRLIAALRKICAWQKRSIDGIKQTPCCLDGFSLMFTTRIGPPNISPEYRQMLRDRIRANMERDPGLVDLLDRKVGARSVDDLEAIGFEAFFKLAMPKLLATMFMEEDWHIDPSKGIEVYEFERGATGARYKMLHLVMDVCRNNPPKERRPPGVVPECALDSYSIVSRQIFERTETVVTPQLVDRVRLERNLELIRLRRKKYYPEGDGLA